MKQHKQLLVILDYLNRLINYYLNLRLKQDKFVTELHHEAYNVPKLLQCAKLLWRRSMTYTNLTYVSVSNINHYPIQQRDLDTELVMLVVDHHGQLTSVLLSMIMMNWFRVQIQGWIISTLMMIDHGSMKVLASSWRSFNLMIGMIMRVIWTVSVNIIWYVL